MGVRIVGGQQLKRNLDIANEQLKQANLNALKEVGEVGVTILKLNTPVDKGRLRGSMTYSIDSIQSDIESPATTEDKMSKNMLKQIVILGTNVIYAARVEYFAQNGSAGYMQRSYNQIKTKVKDIFKRHYEGVIR